jgi:branched-chain amino acid transport system permease protein
MLELLQSIIVYSFMLGSIYLLVSLGFSLICGVLRIFHIGYGLSFVMAIYLTWIFMTEIRLGVIPSIILMILIQLAFGMLIHWGIFQRYLEEEEKLLTLSLLVYLAFAHFANYQYPVTAGVYLPTTMMPGALNIGATTISYQMFIAAISAILTTLVFVFIFLKTKLGLIMRAVSQNLRGSMLMGVNVSLTYWYAVILSLIPPIICTLMISPFWSVDPFMGGSMLNIAILIAILGGLGNLKGSIVASYIIGFIHSVVSFVYISRFMGLAALIVTLIVLLVKPEGLFGAENLW